VLVVERILLAGKAAELGHVGAGGKGPGAGAGDDEGLDGAIGRHGTADVGQFFVHGEGEGVAHPGAVEGDPADGATDVIENFVVHGFHR
jgi:hypothetical protein